VQAGLPEGEGEAPLVPEEEGQRCAMAVVGSDVELHGRRPWDGYGQQFSVSESARLAYGLRERQTSCKREVLLTSPHGGSLGRYRERQCRRRFS
jgi:hypothetical protein